MTPEQIAAFVPPAVVSAVLAFAGAWVLLYPGRFASARAYFSRLALSGDAGARLDAALAQRQAAERIPAWLGRAFGSFSLVLAVVTLLARADAPLGYALWCLALAVMTLVACVRFRRTAQRRIAVLSPRDPAALLPIPVLAAIGSCAVVEIVLAVASPSHAVWAAMSLATVAFIVIAWQIATAPALIFGDDVATEAFVDARLRAGRTMTVAVLSIAPPIVLLGATHDVSHLAVVTWLVVAAAAVVTAVYSWRTMRFAGTGNDRITFGDPA